MLRSLMYLATLATAHELGAGICGEERCQAHGETCCCSPGTCLEDRYDSLVEVEPGLWTVLTRNDLGLAELGPFTNRMVIFKVSTADDNSLVIVNGVNLCEPALAQLRELEQREGAKIRHVIAPGDYHHVYLWQYNVHFPDATVHVPPDRINVVPEAMEPNLTYTLLDMADPLPFLRPHLRVELMRGMGRFGVPRNELFFHHSSTGTLLVGDLMWFYACRPPVDARIPIPAEILAASRGKITVWQHDGTSGFLDLELGARSAQLMLNLSFDRFLSLHGEQGATVPPNSSPSAWELVNEALRTGRGPLAAAELLV